MEQLVGGLRQLVDFRRAPRTAFHMCHCGDPLLSCQRAKGERHEVFVDGGALGAQVFAHVSGQGAHLPQPGRGSR